MSLRPYEVSYAVVASGIVVFFFFFQAEDGIRDDLVTGVQTCALPILFWIRRSFENFTREQMGWAIDYATSTDHILPPAEVDRKFEGGLKDETIALVDRKSVV